MTTTTFGVELEVAEGEMVWEYDGWYDTADDYYSGHGISENKLAKALDKALKSARFSESQRHESTRCWTLKDDGSCGHEITTPVFKANKSTFNKFLKAVRHLRQNLANHRRPLFHEETGLHVHVGINKWKEYQKANLVLLYYMFEPLIMKMIPKKRKVQAYEGSWCWPLRDNHSDVDFPLRRHKENIDEAKRWHAKGYKKEVSELVEETHAEIVDNCRDHYCSVSFSHHYPTVEFRLNQSTFNTNKLRNWLTLLLILASVAKQLPKNFLQEGFDANCDPKPGTFSRLINKYRVPKWLKDQQATLMSAMRRAANS